MKVVEHSRRVSLLSIMKYYLEILYPNYSELATRVDGNLRLLARDPLHRQFPLQRGTATSGRPTPLLTLHLIALMDPSRFHSKRTRISP